MPLNDLLCRNAKPKSKPYKLYDSGGLYLEVLPSKSKYWFYKYHFNGKEKRLALGIYPAVSLSEARKDHEAAKLQRKRGNDPVLVKRQRRQDEEAAKGDTLEVVTREWFELNKGKWKPHYAHEILCRLEKNLFPNLGSDPIRDITTAMLLDRLKQVAERAPHIAKCLAQKSVKVFRFAKQKNKVDVNVALDLVGEFSTKRVTHRKSIEVDELPDFLKALERNKELLPPVSYYATRIMLKTFQRRSELLKAEWTEFDFSRAMWTVPAKRMKMGNEHVVPLSRQTLEDLKALQQITGNRKHLFPGITNPNKSIDLKIIMKVLEQIGYDDTMSTHGFRALAMGVCMRKLKYCFEVPDRQLAHVPENEIRRAYDRDKYLDERVEMMQRYADYIDGLTQPQPTQRTNRDRRPTNTITVQQPYAITANVWLHRIAGSFGDAC